MKKTLLLAFSVFLVCANSHLFAQSSTSSATTYHPRDQIALQLGAIQMGYTVPFRLVSGNATNAQRAANALVMGRNALDATVAQPATRVQGVQSSPPVNTAAFRDQLYDAVEAVVTSPLSGQVRGNVTLVGVTRPLAVSATLALPPNAYTIPVPYAVEAATSLDTQTLATQVSSISGNLSSVRSQTLSLNSTVSTLGSNLTALQSQNSAISGNLVTAQTQIASLTQNMTQIISDVASILSKRKMIKLSGNLTFGDVLVNQSASASFLITNIGYESIDISGISCPSGFSGGWSGTLSPGTSQSVEITFAPTAGQNYSGNVSVNSNATAGGGLIGASGKGVPVLTTTLAGSGSVGNIDGQGVLASFSGSILGLAVDGNGNVYVADYGNQKIRKITPSGNVSTLAGSGATGSMDGQGTAASFWGPRDVAVDGNGNVYVIDELNRRIRKITSNGSVTTFLENTYTNSIAVDSLGNIYLTYDNRIRKATPNGVVSTLAGSGSVGSVDGQGTAASFRDPRGVAVDGSGNVYVGDLGNSRIRKITPSGNVSTLAGSGATGSVDGQGTAASFVSPEFIALDGSGNVYVCDGSAIRKITPSGNVTTVVKSTVSNDIVIGWGVAVDGSGNIYVPDNVNKRIHKITVSQ